MAQWQFCCNFATGYRRKARQAIPVRQGCNECQARYSCIGTGCCAACLQYADSILDRCPAVWCLQERSQNPTSTVGNCIRVFVQQPHPTSLFDQLSCIAQCPPQGAMRPKVLQNKEAQQCRGPDSSVVPTKSKHLSSPVLRLMRWGICCRRAAWLHTGGRKRDGDGNAGRTVGMVGTPLLQGCHRTLHSTFAVSAYWRKEAFTLPTKT